MPEMLEAEAARSLLDERALNREIARVYAPDTWFLKHGTTPAALRHALIGNAFSGARRIGKQIILDTKDPDVRLGVHLGMSGRVVVDDEDAGDPFLYASNKRMPKWHRFGVHFTDGGSFFVRDPRRLGAVVLDPDEARLGPDAASITFAELDAALGKRTAPVKAVLMDQARVAGLGNLLVDEVLWRAGIAPARRADTLGADDRKRLNKTIRQTVRTLGKRGGSHTGDMPREIDGPCPRDGTPLRRETIAGRTTFWCPTHQV